MPGLISTGTASFGSAGEQIADSVAVGEGDNLIEFDVPSWALSGESYARFRVSSAGDLGPKGTAGGWGGGGLSGDPRATWSRER